MKVTDEMIEAGCADYYTWYASATEEQRDVARAAVRKILTAALSASPAGVAKPLEWEKTVDKWRGTERREQWAANTPWGQLVIWHYQMEADEEKRGPKFRVGSHLTAFEPTGIEYDTLEAAKSAAFADYSARIMSAIEPAGVGVETRTFNIGDMVRKRSGSWWEGRVVGFYSTEQTPDGVCVQLDKPMGPVQIYPASALAALKGDEQ